MKLEKIKNFVEEHKTEIIVGAAYVGVLAGSAVLGRVIEDRRIDRRVLKAMGKFGVKEKGKGLKVDVANLIDGCNKATTCGYGARSYHTPADIFTDLGLKTVAGRVDKEARVTGIMLCTI